MHAQTGQVNVFTMDSRISEDAVWSHSGSEIAAINSSHELLLVTYPGGQVSVVPCDYPDGSRCHGEDPTWSPDDQWIAFEDGGIHKVSKTGELFEEIVPMLGWG